MMQWLLCVFMLAAEQSSPLTLTSNLPASGWVPPTQTIELHLSRPLASADGRLAVVIGDTDVSNLVAADGTIVRYAPGALRLGSGESEVVAYVVSASNQWQEVGRFPLRVLTPKGFERASVAPTIDIGFKTQPAEGHSPDSNAPERAGAYRDFTVQGAWQNALVRRGVSFESRAAVVGASYDRETLRFAERGAEAPHVDLASYLISVQGPRARFNAGHVTFGSQRHLVNQFGSRGLSLSTTFGKGGDFALTALSASNTVGWGNPLGITRDGHRMAAATVGVEFVPARAGALRGEASFLAGVAQPVASFNQGAITDAERSRGLGVRLAGSDAGQRLRVDAGFARSTFTNPADPLLQQNADLVPVKEEARDARYLDASVDMVKNRTLGGQSTTVTLAFRHEMVDPLFRSLGALQTQADRMQNQAEVQAVFGQATAQATHTRFEDNLDDIESILKTLTRRDALNVGLPLSVFGGPTPGPNAKWAPRLLYTLDRTHQYGDHLPTNSDFSASHVPDQMSTNQAFGVEFTLPTWRAAYRWGRSNQDNRQIGREAADLANVTNLVTFAVSRTPALEASIDIGFDHAQNKEQQRIDRTRRIATNVSWRPIDRVTLVGTWSRTRQFDDALTSETRGTELNVQASWLVLRPMRNVVSPSARAFLRYSHLFGTIENFTFGLPREDREGWSVNTGVTLTLFSPQQQ